MRLFDFRQNSPITYTAVKYSATGVFGYLFKKDDREVFDIGGLVGPDPDIHMKGFDKELVHKHFDSGLTLAPGVRRTVVDRFEKTDGYYEYVSLKEFDIVVKDQKVSAVSSENGWVVSDGKRKLAEICRIPESERRSFASSGYDMEERYLINMDKKTDTAFYPYIMAIPMLKF